MTAILAVGSSAVLGIVVITAICVAFLWLGWLARNWTFEAQMRLELSIMLMALVVMAAVAVLIVLGWPQQLKLPTQIVPAQQTDESTNHAASSRQAVSEIYAPLFRGATSYPAHQTKVSHPQYLPAKSETSNSSSDPVREWLSIQRESCLCILDHSCDVRTMPNAIELSHGAELTIKPDRNLPQLASDIAAWVPAIRIGVHISQKPLYNVQHFVSGLKPCSLFLGTQTPPITSVNGNERTQNPTSNHPQGILWNLKCAGWYLCHHIWPWILNIIGSFIVGYFIGALAPTPNDSKLSHAARQQTNNCNKK